MASGSLLLKPENARFFDIYTILFSPNLIGSKLVESSEGRAESEDADQKITGFSVPLKGSELVESSAGAEGEGAENIIRSFSEPLKDNILVESSGFAEDEGAEKITSFLVHLKGRKLVESSWPAEDEGAEKISVSRKDSFLLRQLKRIYSSILGTLVIRFSLLVQVLLLLFLGKSILRFLNFILGREKDKEVLKFDIDIKPEDDRKYNAALTAMACEASYETIDCIKTAVKGNPEMEFVGSYGFSEEISRSTIDAFVFQDKRTNTYVLVFRGTELSNVYEWCADVDISYVPFLDHDGKCQGKVHHGFWNLLQESKEKAYNDIRNILKEALKKNKKAKLIVTGHSLGGALAILFTAKLLSYNETDLLDRLRKVHTFGKPRVGNKKFASYMENKLRDHNIIYYRVVYRMDIVPRLPFDIDDGLFRHIAPSIQYNRKNYYQIFKQLPYKNYFSLLTAIPMRLSALFELIMNFTKGRKHRKNLRTMILGLISPGAVAHFSDNYANAPRESFPRADELTNPKVPAQINIVFLIFFNFLFFLFCAKVFGSII